MKITFHRLKNLEELKAIQAQLRAKQLILEKQMISDGKGALISLPLSSFLKPSDPLKMFKVGGKINQPAKVFAYLLQLITNRTLFSRSGFLTKIITAVIVRKIGRRIGPKIVTWLLGIAVRSTPSFTSRKTPLP